MMYDSARGPRCRLCGCLVANHGPRCRVCSCPGVP